MRFLDSVRLVTSRNNVFFRLVHPPNWDSFPYDGLATSKIQIVDMASIAKLAELYRIVDTWVLECFVSCPQNCHFAEKKRLRSRAMAAFDLVLATWSRKMGDTPRYGQIEIY
jgi:hypothetical protein